MEGKLSYKRIKIGGVDQYGGENISLGERNKAA